MPLFGKEKILFFPRLKKFGKVSARSGEMLKYPDAYGLEFFKVNFTPDKLVGP
jgi:hypothetical protein